MGDEEKIACLNYVKMVELRMSIVLDWTRLMKLKASILIFLLFWSIEFPITFAEAKKPDDIFELTRLIIQAESGGKHEGRWGDGGKAYGIAQFHKPTFDCLAQKSGRPYLKWENGADQVWLLQWSLRHGYGAEWTAYRDITGDRERRYCKL